ncbi:lysophospholipid acyltransferase family protein [Luteimonas sp. MJ250]|uniref:lysophospholipid acyltransferase family protein n=1 Tax=Luteimonas sp. MJ250 TaxID=3129236 RepID=UPI0031B9C87B
MRPPTASTASAGAPLARAGRYVLRVPMLLWHALVHLPLVMIGLALPTDRIGLGGESLRDRLARAWQGGLLRVFGLRMRRVGTPLPGGTLFVANHVSWMDISALHSQRMMGFVAKREIDGWPLVGRMARRGGTIFHQRGSQESLGGVLGVMVERLRSGRSVGVFPEGRTRDGVEVGPFHARIFTAAVEAGVPVQPVALRYGARAEGQRVVAFHPHENFVQNFLRLLGEPARVVDVVFLEPVLPGQAEGRAAIAKISRERIVAALREP